MHIYIYVEDLASIAILAQVLCCIHISRSLLSLMAPQPRDEAHDAPPGLTYFNRDNTSGNQGSLAILDRPREEHPSLDTEVNSGQNDTESSNKIGANVLRHSIDSIFQIFARTCAQERQHKIVNSKARNCTSPKSHAGVLKRFLLEQFKSLSSISATQECFIEDPKSYPDFESLVRLCSHGVGSLSYGTRMHTSMGLLSVNDV